MQQQLISKQQQLPLYDPFQSPPDLRLAQRHYRSTLVGKAIDLQKADFCSCCDNIVNKQPLPILFNEDQMLIYGVGYPLYFRLSKYFLLILVCIFFFSGSGYYFFVEGGCTAQSCYQLFGLPIINISAAQHAGLNKTRIINMATAISIFVLVVYIKAVISDDIKRLTGKKICPSSYTVLLQNVPLEGLDQEEFMRWLHSKFGDRPVMLNWAYDVEELQRTYKDKQMHVIELNQCKIQQKKQQQEGSVSDQKLKSRIAQLQRKIQSQRKVLDRYNTQIDCKRIGSVFVTFRTTQTVNNILRRYECSFFNSIMKNMLSFLKKPSLYYRGSTVVVYKAPAPKEVIWDNLGFSYMRSLVFQVFFICSMLLLMFVVWKILLQFMNFALLFKIQQKTTGDKLVFMKALAVSVVILIINCLMRLVIQWFTYAKKYYSFTKYLASYCLYYSIFYITNSCFLVYMVHGHTPNDTAQMLFADIHVVMLASAFSQPIFKLIDPIMWYRWYQRRKISKMSPQENPYTQQYVNKLWQGPSIMNGDNYQYITRMLYITTWFASVAPLGVLLSLLAMALDYYICKWLLVRIYRIPQNISQDIARPTLMMLQLLPLVYICGMLHYNYKVSQNQNIFMFLYQMLHQGVTTIVVLLIVIGYVAFCRRPQLVQVSHTYQQQQLAFGDNYETSNPITKLKGNINFLRIVVNSLQNSFGGQAAQELLKKSSKSSNLLQMPGGEGELRKLKMMMSRKVAMRDDGTWERQMSDMSRSDNKSTVSKRHFGEI